MSKIVSFFQSIRLRAIFTTFLAGIVLLLNTACSNAAQARVPGSTDDGPHPVGQVQPYTGGMNNFDDTAPGQAVKGTAEKTRELVENSKRNIDTKGLGNDEALRNPRDAARSTANKVSKEVGSRADRAQDGIQNVGDRLVKSGERAVDKTQELGERLTRGAENVRDNTARAIDGTATGVKGAADRAANSAKDAID